jgi:hypothetical protein
MTPELGGLESNDHCESEPKLFTYAETTNLTEICAQHLENLAKRHRLGFLARAVETGGQPD